MCQSGEAGCKDKEIAKRDHFIPNEMRAKVILYTIAPESTNNLKLHQFCPA